MFFLEANRAIRCIFFLPSYFLSKKKDAASIEARKLTDYFKLNNFLKQKKLPQYSVVLYLIKYKN